ncbi:plasmid stabilization system protein ParE [Anaerotaenia torta]|uniref:type II toxin-antitoxin system RelE/ParE family toxin n=1 Tax=Anaerotaenia torta TaxID=433293 RepID=UPI003D1E8536
MDKYTVKIFPKAINELDKIYKYIAVDKLSPENAKGQAARIKNAILLLDTFPQMHQDRMEGRYAGKGYKQLLIDNYVAIFKIEEENKTVYVVTIQYQRRNI